MERPINRWNFPFDFFRFLLDFFLIFLIFSDFFFDFFDFFWHNYHIFSISFVVRSLPGSRSTADRSEISVEGGLEAKMH